IEDAARKAEVVRAIEQVIGDVRVCVQDWRPMMTRVGEVISEIRNNPPRLPVDEIAEAVQFLEWLVANNFTFLGVREYSFPGPSGDIEPKFETGLGILRAREVRVLRRGTELVSITPEIMQFLKEPKALIITKANVRSRVHRRVHMDYIGIKRFDAEARLTGELRIVGLFTSTAYTRPARSIPYVRRKIDAVMKRAGFDPDSHSGKALVNVLESYPRDELFQIDEDLLFHFALEVLYLDERPRVRVLARRVRWRTTRSRRRRFFAATAMRSRSPTARPISRQPRSAIFACSRACHRRARSVPSSTPAGAAPSARRSA